MKVKAKITFLGNVGENSESGYVDEGTTIDVQPNRAAELIRADLVAEVPATVAPAPELSAPPNGAATQALADVGIKVPTTATPAATAPAAPAGPKEGK